MWRIIRIPVLVCLAAVVLAFALVPGYVDRARNGIAQGGPFAVSPDAQDLHDQLVIGDWHADTLLWNRDLLRRSPHGHVDVPRLIDGNVALQVFTAVTKSPAAQNITRTSDDGTDNITLLAVAQRWPLRTWSSLSERALHQADRLRRAVDRSGGTLRLITTRAALDAVLADRDAGQQVLGALLGIEGAHALEGDLTQLDRLDAAGYRVIGLHHFFDNELGGSLHGISRAGLTPFGQQVVRAVEARGMILDVAHSAPQVVRDVAALTDMPIVLSHTGLASTCDTNRNLPDELMQLIAQTGGVVAIGYWRNAVCDITPAGIARTIRHAVGLVGADHVSLGSDFDGAVTTAFDTSQLAALTAALLDEGLPPSDIRKVMGGNMVRVLRARLP